MLRSLVGSEMCIRDRSNNDQRGAEPEVDAPAVWVVGPTVFVPEIPQREDEEEEVEPSQESRTKVHFPKLLGLGLDLLASLQPNLFFKHGLQRDLAIATAKPLDDLSGVDLSLIHISEPTRLLSISYAVFCLKKKKKKLRTYIILFHI
eukprot:TRINITY_DN19612_c0_g1_i7.p1 TRINITY_DN19612_c0_g1~~TRINITY_DN19612_c0_g1_i7.p1  ORF type:complete len:148 (+),score=37.62 TRINITY_DN19612_c0_g1_i7:148-591(+)